MTTVKVSFLSDDYFGLAGARPQLAAAFALGRRVIALADGVAYEVIDAGSPVDPISLPPTHTPAPGEPALAPTRPVAERPSDPSDAQGPNLPCPGSALLIGLAALPLRLRRGRAHG
jgi:hypothetical protein